MTFGCIALSTAGGLCTGISSNACPSRNRLLTRKENWNSSYSLILIMTPSLVSGGRVMKKKVASMEEKGAGGGKTERVK